MKRAILLVLVFAGCETERSTDAFDVWATSELDALARSHYNVSAPIGSVDGCPVWSTWHQGARGTLVNSHTRVCCRRERDATMLHCTVEP